METKTSKNIISWGQLFLLIGVFALFLYALTVRVNFNDKTDVVLEGYVFVGSELKSYTGQEKDVTLPTSYSFGEPVYYSGKTTFNSQWEARQFWQEHYACGAEGYYEFYQEIYTHSYPWNYEYTIGRPTYIEGDEVKVNTMAWYAGQNNQYIENLKIPKEYTTTSVRAFQNCPNLKEVYFEDGVEVIGDGIFDGCSSLKKVRLSETTKQIDAYAFFGTAIEEITIPKTVRNFHIGTFYNCTNLKTVTIKSSQIQANHNDYYNHFGNCPLNVIYVPFEALEYYKTTSPWSNYSSLYQALY